MVKTYKSKKVKFRVFNYTVEVVFTNYVFDYAKHIGGLVEHTSEGHMEACTVSFPSTNRSVIVFQPDAPVGTVAHECWHAVRNMMHSIGAGLDDEVVAYHIDYLTQQAFDFQRASAKAPKEKVDNDPET